MKIRPYLKIIPFSLIILSIFILKSFEGQFQHVQNMLILESNNLMSPYHMQVSEEIKINWRKLVKPSDNFSIFGVLEKSSTEEIIAFYATDYNKIILPLKSGNYFSSKDSNEAIVGIGVQTYMLGDGEYYDYNNVRYYVIGKFGLTDDSPLKNTILLNNSLLLDQPNIPLTFDGPNLDKITWLQGRSLGSKGVERWFNISFMSNWIKNLTWLVILCSSFLSMYYYLVVTKEHRNILLEIGIGAKDILKKGIRDITIVALFFDLIIACTIIGKKTFFEFVISSAVIYIILLIAYCILFWRQILKEITYYV